MWWEDIELPWWVWLLVGLIFLVFAIKGILFTLSAYGQRDAQGMVWIPGGVRWGPIRQPWHLMLVCPLFTLAIALYCFWRAYKGFVGEE